MQERPLRQRRRELKAPRALRVMGVLSPVLPARYRALRLQLGWLQAILYPQPDLQQRPMPGPSWPRPLGRSRGTARCCRRQVDPFLQLLRPLLQQPRHLIMALPSSQWPYRSGS